MSGTNRETKIPRQGINRNDHQGTPRQRESISDTAWQRKTYRVHSQPGPSGLSPDDPVTFDEDRDEPVVSVEGLILSQSGETRQSLGLNKTVSSKRPEISQKLEIVDLVSDEETDKLAHPSVRANNSFTRFIPSNQNHASFDLQQPAMNGGPDTQPTARTSPRLPTKSHASAIESTTRTPPLLQKKIPTATVKGTSPPKQLASPRLPTFIPAPASKPDSPFRQSTSTQLPRTKSARKAQQAPVPNPQVILQRAKEEKDAVNQPSRQGGTSSADGGLFLSDALDDIISQFTAPQPSSSRPESFPRQSVRLHELEHDEINDVQGTKKSEAGTLSHWPQCSACKDAGVVCDGEQPCAYCGDAIECDNQGMILTKDKEKALAKYGNGSQSLPVGSQQPAPSGMQHLPPSGAQQSMFDGDTYSEDEPETEALEPVLDIDFFEQQVRKLEKEMRDWQEYMVQGTLNQQKLLARRASRPELTIRSSPFDSIKPQTTESSPILRFQVRDALSTNKQAPVKFIEAPVTTMTTDVKSLPRYKSIGRLGPLPLAPNMAVAKYHPYFPEDEAIDENFKQEKYGEHKERYKTYANYSGMIDSQRRCDELAAMWRPFVHDLLKTLQIDLGAAIAFFEDEEASMSDRDLSGLVFSDEALAACIEAQNASCPECEVTGRPWEQHETWNRVRQEFWGRVEQGPHKSNFTESYVATGLLAYAFRKLAGVSLWHVVRSHSSLRDYVDELDQAQNREAGISNSNFCLVCGLHFCPSHGIYIEEYDSNPQKVILNDPEMALNKREMVIRPKTGLASSAEDPDLGPSALPIDNARRPKKKRGRKSKYEAKKPEDGRVFLACAHAGPCRGNPDCTCFKNNSHCEYMCGCDDDCDIRWKGCRCATGSNRLCRGASCECWNASRECDPWLCGACGVLEVLDQANKYREDIRQGRCRNAMLQLNLPARTIKAPSEVQGYGLFAGEDIAQDGFIGEYRGEVISRNESDRRGVTYHLSGYEYLFNLNADQELDAANFGNKTRFMNNSSVEQNINVVGNVMLCNGVVRIQLTAKRAIKAGEELLYDYDYPDNVREKFWERGQQSASKHAGTVAPGSKRATGKAAKKGRNLKGKGRADTGEEDDAGPAPVQRKKRKHAELERAEDSVEEDFLAVGPVQVVDASDDEDYKVEDDESIPETGESEEYESESGSSEEQASTPRSNQRRRDGRLGGEAQARAWETRKKRMGIVDRD